MTHPNYFYGDDSISQECLKSKYVQNANTVKADIERNNEAIKNTEVGINRLRNELEARRHVGFGQGDPEYDQLESTIRSGEAGLHYLVSILGPALERNHQINLALAGDCDNRIRKNQIRAGMKVPAPTTTPPTVDPDAAVITRNF